MATSAERTAQQAEQSRPVELLARLGLASRGVVWLVVAGLAASVALGQGGRADRTGALGAIRDQPFGEVLLVVMVLGFAGYAVWRLLQAAVGHRDNGGAKRWRKRAVSLARGVLYASFAVSTARFVTGGTGGDMTRPLAARVMGHTGGRSLVGLVGAAVVVGGLALVVRAVQQDPLDKLRGLHGTAVKVVALTGNAGRGLVLALVGAFLVQAAVTFDPDKAKGLDASLKTLAGQPYGSVLLLVAAVGLLAFALWSFVEARYRDI